MKTKKTTASLKIENKERARVVRNEGNMEEAGLSTLEKESRLNEDLSTFTSNLDVGFHQLTEQYDTGSMKSLLMNTLAISSDVTWDIEKENTKKNEVIEEIESDSELEMQVDSNKQIDQNLRSKLYELDQSHSIDKSNQLVIEELDIFIEMRIIKDTDPYEFFDIFKEKHQIESHMISLEDNNFVNRNNFGDDFDLNDPPQFDNISVQSDMMYSFENGMPSNEIDFTEQSQHNKFIPKDRYEVESTIMPFNTGGDGIFRETSFLVMDTELTGSSSIRDQINLKRTINKLKKIGDGSTIISKPEGNSAYKLAFTNFY